jgi:hypothetical protein
MELTMWSSVLIVLAFSFLVIGLDEYVVKPWRERRWEQRAAAGDKDAIELLRLARAAKVSEE